MYYDLIIKVTITIIIRVNARSTVSGRRAARHDGPCIRSGLSGSWWVSFELGR